MSDQPTTVTVAWKQAKKEVVKAWTRRSISKQVPYAMFKVLVAIFYAMLRVFKNTFIYIFKQLQKLLPLPI
jgi:hypothetical protein